jgi:hypothetical protein
MAGSPFGGMNDLIRKARRVENQVKSAVRRQKTLPYPRPIPHPIVKPGPRPRPIPNPIIKPGPKPGPDPIIIPGPGPLPSPKPIDDHVIQPCPKPVIGPQPYPVPVIDPACEPVQQPEDTDGELPVIHESQQVDLPVEGLSPAGTVIVKLGPIAKQAKVLRWGPDRVVFEVPTLGLAEAAPATLVLVSDNGTTLGDIEFLYAPQPPVPTERPQVPVGSRLTLNGKDFGQQQGNIWIEIGQIRLNANIISWTADEAVVEMPKLDLASPTAAELIVAQEDGVVVDRTAIELIASN